MEFIVIHSGLIKDVYGCVSRFTSKMFVREKTNHIGDVLNK